MEPQIRIRSCAHIFQMTLLHIRARLPGMLILSRQMLGGSTCFQGDWRDPPFLPHLHPFPAWPAPLNSTNSMRSLALAYMWERRTEGCLPGWQARTRVWGAWHNLWQSTHCTVKHWRNDYRSVVWSPPSTMEQAHISFPQCCLLKSSQYPRVWCVYSSRILLGDVKPLLRGLEDDVKIRLSVHSCKVEETEGDVKKLSKQYPP